MHGPTRAQCGGIFYVVKQFHVVPPEIERSSSEIKATGSKPGNFVLYVKEMPSASDSNGDVESYVGKYWLIHPEIRWGKLSAIVKV